MMYQTIKNKVMALLLVLIMVLSMVPVTAMATETDEFKVVISMEGATLGQGLYVEPKEYTLDEINTLVATEGYGPFTEDELTAGMATLAMMLDKGLEYTNTGSWNSGFYLSSVKGIDKGTVSIPAFITENGGPDNDTHDGNSDEYLGEFDYSFMAGWMITCNDYMITTGCADWDMKNKVAEGGQGEDYGNTFVIRWHYTLWGYGSDLGFSTEWNTAYFEHANKDLLYAAYAASSDAEAKTAALPVMMDLQATDAEVATALNVFETSTEPDTSPDTAQDVSTVLNDTMAQLATTVTAPAFGTSAGEWTVLSLARGDYYTQDNAYFSDYYNRIVTTVNETAASVTLANGALHKVKSTENSRLILALSAIGKDATSVGDWNLITPFEDFSWIKKQGINGPIFALIALDTNDYQTTDTTIRQQCVDYILGKQLDDGGWALSGTASDPDITAMALQALVNYNDQTAVATAAEEAFAWLSSAQNENGGYASWGTVNCESIAQVIVACTAWGINPDTDARFVKANGSVVDAIQNFYDAAAKGFKHVSTGTVNDIATDQACYALVAYDRFLNGKTSLYDMSDVTFEEVVVSKDPAAGLGLPEKVEAGKSFNATVTLSAWDNDADYKLMDFIVSVPEGITVDHVEVGNRLTNGAVSYNLEESTGKLRVAYFDANENKSLVLSGTDFPAELFTVTFDVPVDYDVEKPLELAITGMSLKKSSDPTAEEDTTVIDVSKATGKVEVTSQVTVTAKELYVGDGVDLIAENKHAVALFVTGVDEGVKVTYTADNNSMEFMYSKEMSEKVGVTTYVALVDTTFTLEKLGTKDNYTIKEGTPATITFADGNDDGVVNAQDALASVDAWLRKSAPTDDQILALNVNGDNRLNTYDALGIVESFVNGTDHNVVTKAATMKPAETAEKTA